VASTWRVNKIYPTIAGRGQDAQIDGHPGARPQVNEIKWIPPDPARQWQFIFYMIQMLPCKWPRLGALQNKLWLIIYNLLRCWVTHPPKITYCSQF